ncbi:hypothetical protein SAMN06269117_11345 [Balnearium lithotrophicum]|uniref:Uncharacterized protein n=1 Tax=Balnearium lithotrophicum TaxID=223788 RepID=A0A521CJP6_9BACT|nr:hypothetical protein [Balnearium lithotrophicum]SMO59683.1 hypothetical protein SAMN06269117_11345 [Balnearium lithotrophicum]
MPMSPGATKTGGTKGTTRKASARVKAGKVNKGARSVVKAMKHGGFAGSGYKTGKKLK